MNKVLKVLVVLPAILFTTMGLRWLIDPAGIAPEFGFELSVGEGLSSQIGDMSGYFLTLGLSMLIAVVTGQRAWYYPPAMLLLLTAVGRTLAWLVHDAALSQAILVEVIVASILLISASKVAEKD